MTLFERLAAVVPLAEPSITAREAGDLAGIERVSAQKAMRRLVVAGRVREAGDHYPARYLRNEQPPAPVYVPVSSVQHAIKYAPKSVWDLAR